MPVLLVRPYPVALLGDARTALGATLQGDLGPLQRLYQAAAQGLAALDPDEADDFRQDFRNVAKGEQTIAHAAVAVADTWEGIVVVGSMLRRSADFRAFASMVAQIRYDLGPAKRDPAQVKFYARGGGLPDTDPADAALYLALPALIGLGPELPEELAGPCPLPGDPVGRLLGLPEDDDWTGLDPLDGIAISAEACRAHFAQAPAAWRPLLSRSAETGLLVRDAESS